MGGVRIGLDNPALIGRVRRYGTAGYVHRPAPPVRPRLISDVRPATIASQKKRGAGQPTAPPSAAPVRSQVRYTNAPTPPAKSARRRQRFRQKLAHRLAISRIGMPSFALTAAAILVVGLGLAIGFNGLRANHQVQVQARRLEKDSGSGNTPADVPSETKPAAVSIYQVAPDLPRLLIIPKLGVNARVLRFGVTTNNALATPPNIFDTGWYDESSEPGQPGATLIDGHVSGPTQHGVFYGLKTLVPGDAVKLERGDGKIFTYKVVTSKTYDANNVDMAAALTPIVAGKSGLNLITCTGQLDASKTHFQQRIMVFATLQ